MAYSRPYSVHHPGCLIFLVDQSGSMEEPFGADQVGVGERKMDVVAAVLNNLLMEIGRRCQKGLEVRPRVFVAAVGYGGAYVGSILPDRFGGRELVSITHLMDNPLRVEQRMQKEVDDAGEVLEFAVDFPVWLDGRADGGTPMCAAIGLATRLVEQWIPSHQDSFPPIVINITDGEATDGDAREVAQMLRSLCTAEGNVLLFNCHLSANKATEVVYPAPGDPLPPYSHDASRRDPCAHSLFEMSSEIPETILWLAREDEPHVKLGGRGLVLNASADLVHRIVALAANAGTTVCPPRFQYGDIDANR